MAFVRFLREATNVQAIQNQEAITQQREGVVVTVEKLISKLRSCPPKAVVCWDNGAEKFFITGLDKLKLSLEEFFEIAIRAIQSIKEKAGLV